MLSGSSTSPPAGRKVDGLPPAPSFRVIWHRNREGIIRRASLKYSDAWIRPVLSTEAELLFIFPFFLVMEWFFLIKLELQMSSRAPRHINGKTIVRRAIS
eukprot:6592381-Pyramimonas_sp.AAC.1